MLRGAISGFGAVAERAHLAGWLHNPDVILVALHEPVAARRHAALALLPNLRVYDDLELMLAGERLDWLDIASPPAYHYASARAALAAGVNVLVEKPLCLDLTEFTALTTAAAQASRLMMCVHNWKFALAYRCAREVAAQGRLGELEYLSLRRLRTAAAGAPPATAAGAGWRTAGEQGGGILIDHAWHIFYLTQFLFGATPTGIAARLGRRPGSAIEDFAQLRIDFGARMAEAHLSWRAPVRRTSAMLYGSAGMLEIEENRVILYPRTGAPKDLSVADAADDSYHPSWFSGAAAEFVQAVRTGPSTTAAQSNLLEAKYALALIIAARQSDAQQGSSISL